jgi:RimJ/RimL family protein N-acetyltransferase
VSEGWLARRDVPNMGHLVGWVDSFWHTHADFARASFGAFLMHENAVASWCLGVFASGTDIELGLATMPQYCGQGYATAVAACCVAYCADHGLTPRWHCWEDNVASWRIAEKVGLVDPTPYTVYTIQNGA